MNLFHVCSIPALVGLGASATLKLATSILNLICAEISVTSVWLPSSRILQLSVFRHFECKGCLRQLRSRNLSLPLESSQGLSKHATVPVDCTHGPGGDGKYAQIKSACENGFEPIAGDIGDPSFLASGFLVW